MERSGTVPLVSQCGKVRLDIKAPIGHVVLNEKWINSNLYSELQKRTNVTIQSNLGIADFHIGDRTCIVMVTEADLVLGNQYKRSIVQLRKAAKDNNLKSVVLIENAGCAKPLFAQAQKFVAIQLGMVCVQIGCHDEAAAFVAHAAQSRHKGNPFAVPYRVAPLSTKRSKTMFHLPLVKFFRMQLLAKNYKDLKSLLSATESDLKKITDPSSAQEIAKFLHFNFKLTK